MWNTLFWICNVVSLVGWIMLALAPRWKRTDLVTRALIPLMFALAYVTLFVTGIPSASGGFNSLADLRQLFSSDAILLAGWAHYLAFDLFVGSWQVRDSQRVGMKHALVAPCLVLTWLLGPTGLLAYHLLRWKHGVRNRESCVEAVRPVGVSDGPVLPDGVLHHTANHS